MVIHQLLLFSVGPSRLSGVGSYGCTSRLPAVGWLQRPNVGPWVAVYLRRFRRPAVRPGVSSSRRFPVGCDCRRFRCPFRCFTVGCNMPTIISTAISTDIPSAIRRFLPCCPGWFFRCCRPVCRPLSRPMFLPLSGRYSGKGKQKSRSLYHFPRKWQLLAASGIAWHSKVPHFHSFTPLPLPPSDRVQSGCLPAVVTRLPHNPPPADFYVH